MKKAFTALVMVFGFALVANLGLATFSVSAVGLDDGIKATQTDETTAEDACLFKGSKDADDNVCESGFVTDIINVFLFLIGALSVVMIIYGGIRYVTSAGDSGRVTSAKNTIMYAVVGLVVAILAFAIVNFVVGSLISE